MLSAREKSPDTALRIKEVEQNIWRHTISCAVAPAVWPLKPHLSCVPASAKCERGQTLTGKKIGLLVDGGSGRL